MHFLFLKISESAQTLSRVLMKLIIISQQMQYQYLLINVSDVKGKRASSLILVTEMGQELIPVHWQSTCKSSPGGRLPMK